MTINSTSGPRGRAATKVPHFGEKLDYLLSCRSQSQKWLTTALINPHGMNPSASGICGWKDKGRLPSDYVIAFCRLFTIDEAILLEPEFDRFKQLVVRRELDMIGSGKHWKRLLEQAIEPPHRLLVQSEGDPLPQLLRNVTFGHDAQPVKAPPIPHVPIDEPIRFAIPAATVSEVLREGCSGTLMLFCEDRLGWKTLAPHQRDPGFVREENQWLLPGSLRKALLLEPPMGLYRAVALITRTSPSQSIVHDLKAGRTVEGTDALALELLQGHGDYRLYQREFNVIAANRR